jgi:hypothetical protein
LAGYTSFPFAERLVVVKRLFRALLSVARNLECGDLSPLSFSVAKGEREIQSGDKSPHSKI